MWRYRGNLPVRRTEDIVSLGESETPLVSLPRLSEELGTAATLVKDEGRLPTGTFKARGLLDLCMFSDGSKNEQELAVTGDTGKVELQVQDDQ